MGLIVLPLAVTVAYSAHRMVWSSGNNPQATQCHGNPYQYAWNYSPHWLQMNINECWPTYKSGNQDSLAPAHSVSYGSTSDSQSSIVLHQLQQKNRSLEQENLVLMQSIMLYSKGSSEISFVHLNLYEFLSFEGKHILFWCSLSIYPLQQILLETLWLRLNCYICHFLMLTVKTTLP